ncbi:MAG TPA: hypothetical protein PK095_21175, partial [Myxococcota bacterium]|nr:hypothetical protein [Myxococcota bacterium]
MALPRIALLSCFALVPACDSGDPAPVNEAPPAVTSPGPACLTTSTELLSFGPVLAGQVQTGFVGYESCDGEAVELFGIDVPDDGDMLLASRVYRADDSVITPRYPYVLAGDEVLVVAVSYRARASADDLPVSRTLRLEAESRVTPDLPAKVDVGLAAQPVTACPDDACGGPADSQV